MYQYIKVKNIIFSSMRDVVTDTCTILVNRIRTTQKILVKNSLISVEKMASVTLTFRKFPFLKNDITSKNTNSLHNTMSNQPTPRSPLKSIPEFFRDWVMSKSVGGGDSIMLRTPPKKLSLDDSNYFNERLKDYKNEFKQNNLPDFEEEIDSRVTSGETLLSLFLDSKLLFKHKLFRPRHDSF